MTADLGDGCTDRHTGTSAAQPLVSGFIALALEAKYVSYEAIGRSVLKNTLSKNVRTSPGKSICCSN